MIIAYAVDKEGQLNGHFMYGPPDETSFDQGPAGNVVIDTTIIGEGYRFENGRRTARYELTIASNGTLRYTFANIKGQSTTRVFTPVWRLTEAERKAHR
jgi:hypothetical protein